MARVHEHCVVGHGLLGTAACRYLAEAGEDVVLVGPSEGRGAHGACYDEGRIYRILDPQESWARLAEKSIEEYGGIAERSGVDFYHESGLLIFGVRDDFVRKTEATAAAMHTSLLHMTPAEISARFPYLAVPGTTELGLLQTEQAGHLSPRKLNEAQLLLSQRRGALHVDAEVASVTRSAETQLFRVETSGGGEVLARNVLVAAGCYTSVLPLLPEEVVVSLTGAQALLVEISAEDAAKMADCPSMIYEGPTEEDCVYLLPPIRYPDGKWLVKVGPSTAFAPPLHGSAEVDAWFRNGALDPEFERRARSIFKQLFPTVREIGSRPLLCVTDNTPTLNAYVDLLEPGWGICSGGNGWAAKSSDAIGHLAAQMMALPGHWTPDPSLPRQWFRAVTKPALLPTPQLETALASVDACGEVMASRAVEALRVATALLAAKPLLLLRPRGLAAAVQEGLLGCWGAGPTVCCLPPGGAWVPGQPFVLLRIKSFQLLILVPP